MTFSRSKHNYHSSFLVSSNIPYDCVLGWDFITQHKLSVHGDFLGGRSRYQLVGTYGKIPIHAEHPAMKVQSNGVVITEVNSPVVSPSEGSKTNAVLVQSQLKGVNKVILPEGVAIPARSEMVIEGNIQAAIFKTGNGESGNQGIRESGNRGIWESGNPPCGAY